jgi:aldehyde:ferredoxin oxidoreductase
MLKYGYGGRVLRVNLSSRIFSVESLDPSWIRPVVGGRAANTKRLFEELESECDPLGEENIIIFGTGPLTGSLLPASAYYTVTAKSPLTGILGDSAAGGQFAAEMKQTAFDQIIITGKADNLVYLLVTESGVEFFECSELSGKTIGETTETIRHDRCDYLEWEQSERPNRNGCCYGFQKLEGPGCKRNTLHRDGRSLSVSE